MQNAVNPEFLVCPPTYMSLSVPINPQMITSRRRNHQICTNRATTQWENAITQLSCAGAVIYHREAIPNLQDLTFCADAGFVEGNTVLLSKYKFPVRELESKYHRKWFAEKGYIILNSEYYFEGGDVSREGNTVILGHGFRSDFKARNKINSFFPKCNIVSIRLANPYFYHLDTCLHLLDEETVLYYPPAVDASSRAILKKKFRAIELRTDDALNFAANMVKINGNAFLHDCSPYLETTLEIYDYRVTRLPLSEFLKTGGSIKCLMLRLR